MGSEMCIRDRDKVHGVTERILFRFRYVRPHPAPQQGIFFLQRSSFSDSKQGASERYLSFSHLVHSLSQFHPSIEP